MPGETVWPSFRFQGASTAAIDNYEVYLLPVLPSGTTDDRLPSSVKPLYAKTGGLYLSENAESKAMIAPGDYWILVTTAKLSEAASKPVMGDCSRISVKNFSKSSRQTVSVPFAAVWAQNAAAAVAIGRNDVHAIALDRFLTRNYGQPGSLAIQQNEQHEGEWRTRLASGASDAGTAIVADIGRAADALQSAKASRKTIELAGHSTARHFTRDTHEQGGNTYLDGGLTSVLLGDVGRCRKRFAEIQADIDKARAKGDSQGVRLLKEEMVNYPQKTFPSDEWPLLPEVELDSSGGVVEVLDHGKLKVKWSDPFLELAEKLEAVGVDQLNLQSCRAGSGNPVGTVGGLVNPPVQDGLQILLSTATHTISVGAHTEDLTTDGAKNTVQVGDSGIPHSRSLPAPAIVVPAP
jgi:hypothetical protein